MSSSKISYGHELQNSLSFYEIHQHVMERSERSKIEAAVAAGQPSPPPTPLSLPSLPLTGGDSSHNPFADGAWPSPRLSRATIRSRGGGLGSLGSIDTREQRPTKMVADRHQSKKGSQPDDDVFRYTDGTMHISYQGGSIRSRSQANTDTNHTPVSRRVSVDSK